MRNVARNSKFDIRIDFDKSHDSYLFDKNTNKKYLDFFGMYASLPLGYSHEVFQSQEYKEEITPVILNKLYQYINQKIHHLQLYIIKHSQ